MIGNSGKCQTKSHLSFWCIRYNSKNSNKDSERTTQYNLYLSYNCEAQTVNSRSTICSKKLEARELTDKYTRL